MAEDEIHSPVKILRSPELFRILDRGVAALQTPPPIEPKTPTLAMLDLQGAWHGFQQTIREFDGDDYDTLYMEVGGLIESAVELALSYERAREGPQE